MFKLLFVCTGNTCRSPMAEAITKKILQKKNIKKIEVSSAGIYTETGNPISENTLSVLKEKDIEESYLKTTNFFELDAAAYDLILTMDSYHKKIISLRFDIKNIYTLKEFIGMKDDVDVQDPYGSDISNYRTLYASLNELCLKAVEKIENDYL